MSRESGKFNNLEPEVVEVVEEYYKSRVKPEASAMRNLRRSVSSSALEDLMKNKNNPTKHML